MLPHMLLGSLQSQLVHSSGIPFFWEPWEGIKGLETPYSLACGSSYHPESLSSASFTSDLLPLSYKWLLSFSGQAPMTGWIATPQDSQLLSAESHWILWGCRSHQISQQLTFRKIWLRCMNAMGQGPPSYWIWGNIPKRDSCLLCKPG